MFESIARQMKEKIRASEYIMTLHAEEEMEEDDLTIRDVETAVLTGVIIERQRDHETREWKYLVEGSARDESRVAVVGKLGPTGKLVIITTYRA